MWMCVYGVLIVVFAWLWFLRMATVPGLWSLQGYPVQLPSKGFWFPDFAKKKKKN